MLPDASGPHSFDQLAVELNRAARIWISAPQLPQLLSVSRIRPALRTLERGCQAPHIVTRRDGRRRGALAGAWLAITTMLSVYSRRARCLRWLRLRFLSAAHEAEPLEPAPEVVAFRTGLEAEHLPGWEPFSANGGIPQGDECRDPRAGFAEFSRPYSDLPGLHRSDNQAEEPVGLIRVSVSSPECL